MTRQLMQMPSGTSRIAGIFTFDRASEASIDRFCFIAWQLMQMPLACAPAGALALRKFMHL